MHKAIILGLVLACAAAHASDWMSLGKSPQEPTKAEVFIDLASISIVSGMRRAWFKTVYVPRSAPDKTNSSRWLSYGMERTSFRCQPEEFRNDAMEFYMSDGTSTKIPRAAIPEEWAVVSPDTVLDLEMKFICAWKPK
jgi:hypothetical protein